MSADLLPDNAPDRPRIIARGRCNGVAKEWIDFWLSQGWTSRMVADRVGVPHDTIRKFLQIRSIPTARQRAIARDPSEAHYRHLVGRLSPSREARL